MPISLLTVSLYEYEGKIRRGDAPAALLTHNYLLQGIKLLLVRNKAIMSFEHYHVVSARRN